ncbi:hypothetical protein BFP72_04155 [Reichenbachiella sp. 5M10]|nr:hypothetical protein BFP72_04155 [Reichenbachiella sp. 5M10]
MHNNQLKYVPIMKSLFGAILSIKSEITVILCGSDKKVFVRRRFDVVELKYYTLYDLVTNIRMLKSKNDY